MYLLFLYFLFITIKAAAIERQPSETNTTQEASALRIRVRYRYTRGYAAHKRTPFHVDWRVLDRLPPLLVIASFRGHWDLHIQLQAQARALTCCVLRVSCIVHRASCIYILQAAASSKGEGRGIMMYYWCVGNKSI